MKGILIIRRIISVILIVLLAVLLNACGGGGGGDGGGGSDAGISYTGITSQAIVDDSNAADFSTGAYQGGNTGSALGGIAAIQTKDHKQIGRPRTLKLTQTLETAIVEVDVTAPSGVAISGAIQQESDTIQGDCPGTPGSAAYTIQYDDVTGDFSGTFNFNNYCSEGVTLSGSASFSGKVDPDALEFLRFSITFNNLKATSDRDSFTTKGSITYDFETSQVTATMDLLLKDNSTGKVYWVKYNSMTLVEGPNYVEFEMSGTYYDPDYGYVVLSTEVPFVVYDGEDWPSDGVLVATGDTGVAGGSTKARLTALSSTTYQVEADTDGDGQYDWDSGILFWDEHHIPNIPEPGTWSGPAGFGEIDLVVTSDSTGIESIGITFIDFSCGTITSDGSITFSQPNQPWPISNSQFIAELEISQEREMTIKGTFADTGTNVSGIYEADYDGTICTGTWDASPE